MSELQKKEREKKKRRAVLLPPSVEAIEHRRRRRRVARKSNLSFSRFLSLDPHLSTHRRHIVKVDLERATLAVGDVLLWWFIIIIIIFFLNQEGFFSRLMRTILCLLF